MKEKEFVLDQLYFQTERGLEPAEFQTDNGIKPFYVNIELTDAIKATHKLTSIGESKKDEFIEVLSDHWDNILENVNNCLGQLPTGENEVFDLFVKAFDFYIDNKDLLDIFMDVLKNLS